MEKFYRQTDAPWSYWECWENDDGTYTVHTGVLGDTGTSKTLSPDKLKSEMVKARANGFEAISDDDLHWLAIEYKIDGMGTSDDLSIRHALEDQMNETLGWTGLGHCDGGSIGSGTMEVFCLVVDFELAKTVVMDTLAGTQFAGFARIYTM